MSTIGASFLTRTVLSSASAHTPVVTAVVYNAVDMLLCGLVFKYLQSKAKTERDKGNAELSSIFYSRCIGCLGGIVAARLFCQRPIHPLFALGINISACLACFLTVFVNSPSSLNEQNKGSDLWV
jgi:hypothetical protein